ncbi:MAG: hypothetical protein R2769_06920 [Saprospiraceae bacterium]
MKDNFNINLKEKGDLKTQEEYAVLVGVMQRDETEEMVQEYLDELEFLALTAGAQCKKRFLQKLQHPDTRTFVGSGKGRRNQTIPRES